MQTPNYQPSEITCVICRAADATDEDKDYCVRCTKVAAEAEADDSVSCADFLRVCQERVRREEALADCPPALRGELDSSLTNALILGKAFDSIFARIR